MTQTPADGPTLEISLTDPPTTARLDTVLLGRTFTHLLTDDDIERDVLPMTPDFAAVWPLIGTSPYNTVNGLPCSDLPDDEANDEEAMLHLEPGTLAPFSAGSLIGIRIADDGLYLGAASEPDGIEHMMLTTAFIAEAGMIPELGGRPEEDADDHRNHDGSVALEEFLLLACLRHPELFTTAALPVTELLVDLGLDHDHGQIAVQGFDFEAEDDELTETEELERLTETYDLTEVQALAVLAFTTKIDATHDAIHNWTDEPEGDGPFPEIEVDDLLPWLPALSEPMVAVAIADENLTGDAHLGSVLAMILATVRSEVPRRGQAGLHWLMGRCIDLLNEFTDAEAQYNLALELDADFYPAMRELATLASLRGDAETAVSLLNRAGVPADDAELEMVARYVGETRNDIGRNDPCWCGSGRKYKKCHLGQSDFDLASRREWLYHKVSQWIINGAGHELVIVLAASVVDPADGPEAVIAAMPNPLLLDVTIFEGGLIDAFIETRAALLPIDEQDLLIEWQKSRRALYSVESIGPGGSVRLTDLVTGAVAELTGDAAAVSVGDLVCLRALPAGGSVAAPGGIVVVPADRRELTMAMLALQDTGDADPLRTVGVLITGRPID